jgi:hypothetical protein
MAAPTQLQAPGCPDSLEDFLKQVDENREAWYNYVCEAANQNAYLSNENASLREQVIDLQEKGTAIRAELSEAQGVIRFQQKEKDTLATRAIRAEIELDQALQKATQAVNTSATPPTSISTPAEITQDTLPRATAFIAPEPSETSRLSEKLPDTDKFSGDGKDLNRFTTQIYQKLTINRDRFRTPEERMAYVTSRLTGLAYAQVAPRIRFGKHQFSDFEDILNLMEEAFGDPDRVQNAQNALYRLRQKNQDFSTFHAEFERLALEGEMIEASLGTLLMQNISFELHEMLLHTPTPSKEYRPLVRHLQELDNRHRQHQFRKRQPAPRSYAITATSPVTKSYSSPRAPSPTPPYSQVTTRVTTEPMDLSNTRRRPDKETGNCFRCHQSGHRIRDCPQPDTRPQSVQRRDSDARRYRMSVMNARSPSPPQSPSNRFSVLQPTPVRTPTPAFTSHQMTESENGVRLR